jgi:fatty acid CoA ligase FadD9
MSMDQTSAAPNGCVPESSVELFARVCQIYADRPCLSFRGDVITYGEFWARVVSLSGALAERISPGERVGICGFGSIDWVIADLSCLYLGAVSVPLETSISPPVLQHAMAQTGMTVLFCDQQECERLKSVIQPQVQILVTLDGKNSDSDSPCLKQLLQGGERTNFHPSPCDQSLYSIVFTSGSTGQPKGVMLSHQRWNLTLRDALTRDRRPDTLFNYLPLCHMAGRINLYATMMEGGLTWLVSSGDMSTLFADLREARPTHMVLVPRISEMLYQRFLSDYLAQGGTLESIDSMLTSDLGKTVADSLLRETLGGRLQSVDIGAAPTPPDVKSFLRKGLGLQVTELYGSTEMGPVSRDGVVHPWLAYKLVARPDLGYSTQDKPFPRGELAVKSPRQTWGYYNDPEATAKLTDADGYILSGDIVEQRGPRELVWLARANDVVRLSNGEFVPLAGVENLLTSRSPLIHQVFLYSNPLKSHLLAVIVPSTKGVNESQLRAEVQRIARETDLEPFQVPREILLEREPFSRKNGLLTSANKLRRPQLKKQYGDRLEDLYRNIEQRQYQDASKSSPIVQVVRQVLGIDQVHDESIFLDIGGDSLSAVQVCEAMWSRWKTKLSVTTLLDPTRSLKEATDHGQGLTVDDVHNEEWAAAQDLRISRFMDLSRQDPAPAGNVTLLTGATGFLGRFLALELLHRLPPEGRLICLLRGADNQNARDRMLARFQTLGLRQIPNLARMEVWAGDLTRPLMGLERSVYEKLAAEVDSVIHNAAVVNHTLSYPELFEPNVGATLEVIRFGLAGRSKSLHYVSSLGLAAGLERTQPVLESESADRLWPTRPLRSERYAGGYVTSKWASEILLEDLHRETGTPVTVSRCGLILPHRGFSTDGNLDDALSRMLYGIFKTGLAPTSFARVWDGLPADTVASFVVGLARSRGEGIRRYHLSHPNGLCMDRLLEVAERSCRLRRLPYPEFLDQFKEHLQRLDPEERRASPLTLLGGWQADPVPTSPLGTTEFRTQLESSSGSSELPSVNNEIYLEGFCRAVLSRVHPS